MTNEIQKAVINVVLFSDGIMMIQINGTSPNNYTAKMKINIIQVYAPTTDHDDQEIENFYSQIREM